VALASLLLAAVFTRLWQPPGGGELNHSPITLGKLHTSSYNALSETYAVLGPLDAPLAEALIADRPLTPAVRRLERCRQQSIHLSFGIDHGEPRAWVWTPTKVLWTARAAHGHLPDLAEWAYQTAFLPRCPDPTRLPPSYFK
jgi:hypothetical protein